MDPHWKHWDVSPGRHIEILSKSTGWFVRLVQNGETVKTAWPFEHLVLAQHKAVEMAVQLKWFKSSPEGY